MQNPLYFDFYVDYAIAGLTSGEAVTLRELCGRPAGRRAVRPDQATAIFHAVLIGADTERLGKQSPGMQIIYQVIKRRFAEGFRSFDMGLGNTGYKSQFRVERRSSATTQKPFPWQDMWWRRSITAPSR